MGNMIRDGFSLWRYRAIHFPGRFFLLVSGCIFLAGPGFGSENPCFCNGLAIYAFQPALPFLIDPLGRRLGTDPKDGVSYNEMGALYTLGEPSNTTLPTSSKKRNPYTFRYIHLRPMLGRYLIHAVGVGNGPYKVEIISKRGDCTEETVVRKGNTRKGKVDVLEHEYSDGSGDSIPPVTQVDYVEGVWLNQSRAILQFQSADTCSGLAKLFVKTEGGEEIRPGLVEMRKEGESKLEFWSMDNAGNEEARRNLVVRCDFTPPTLAHDFAGDSAVFGPVDIRFKAADAVSGIASVQLQIMHIWYSKAMQFNRRQWSQDSELLRLSEPGTYYLSYAAVDLAGNWSPTERLTLRVEKKPWYKRWH